MRKRPTPKDVFAVVDVRQSCVPLVRGRTQDSLRNLGKAVIAERFVPMFRQANDAQKAHEACLHEIAKMARRLRTWQLRVFVGCLAAEAYMRELRRMGIS